MIAVGWGRRRRRRHPSSERNLGTSKRGATAENHYLVRIAVVVAETKLSGSGERGGEKGETSPFGRLFFIRGKVLFRKEGEEAL